MSFLNDTISKTICLDVVNYKIYLTARKANDINRKIIFIHSMLREIKVSGLK